MLSVINNTRRLHGESEDLCLNREFNPLALGFMGGLTDESAEDWWSMTAADGEAICDSATAINHISAKKHKCNVLLCHTDTYKSHIACLHITCIYS